MRLYSHEGVAEQQWAWHSHEAAQAHAEVRLGLFDAVPRVQRSLADRA